MTDIRSWLAAHGFERFTDVFVENEIDLEALSARRHCYFFFGCGPELTWGANLFHSFDATQYRQKSP